MSEWQPIETFVSEPAEKTLKAIMHTLRHVLVSNGRRTYVAWFDDSDGWRDSTCPDHMESIIQPPPIKWQEMPAP